MLALPSTQSFVSYQSVMKLLSSASSSSIESEDFDKAGHGLDKKEDVTHLLHTAAA